MTDIPFIYIKHDIYGTYVKAILFIIGNKLKSLTTF